MKTCRDRSPCMESLEARVAMSTTAYSAHIDFQPASSTTTSGYVADTGKKVQVQNGLNYGWSATMSAGAVDRGVSGAGNYNTFITATGKNWAWEAILPNGQYTVTVAVGDPTKINSTYDLDVNGQAFLTGTPTRKQHILTKTQTVTVNNGRLILSDGSDASNTKLSSIDITPVQATAIADDTSDYTTGNPIQAHGGQIIYRNGVYYWFGENKDGPTSTQATIDKPRVDVIGVSVYASLDLKTWDYRGLALSGSTGDLAPGGVLERPKVIYNAQMGYYVMWMHIDNATYTDSRVGVAVSRTLIGPYTYLKSFKPLGLDSRDMTVFQDDDGSSYLVFATNNNQQIRIAKMTDDYLSLTGQSVVPFTGQGQREAPQLVKSDGYYYLLTSGATWFDPNAAMYAVSTSVLGKYTVKGNPISGSGAATTYDSQGAYIFQIADTGHYYLLADQWNQDDLGASTYEFMQVVMKNGKMTISSPAALKPTLFSKS